MNRGETNAGVVMSAMTSSAPPEGQQQEEHKMMMPFRELPVRPRMVVPEWLPMNEDKEIKYALSLVNGVYQNLKQEVRLRRFIASITKEGCTYLPPFLLRLSFCFPATIVVNNWVAE